MTIQCPECPKQAALVYQLTATGMCFWKCDYCGAEFHKMPKEEKPPWERPPRGAAAIGEAPPCKA